MRKTGIEEIAQEVKRVREVEGYTIEHDDEYVDNQMAKAAATYALRIFMDSNWLQEDGIPGLWPWDDQYWKPSPDDRIKELRKAGALIVFEIERLKRLELSQHLDNINTSTDQE